MSIYWLQSLSCVCLHVWIDIVECEVKLSAVYSHDVFPHNITGPPSVSHIPRRRVLAPDWPAAKATRHSWQWCCDKQVLLCPLSQLNVITHACWLDENFLNFSYCWFSALTLLVGQQEGIRPVKNWVVGCWHGYLSGAMCRFAYGPADATATHCLLLQ